LGLSAVLATAALAQSTPTAPPPTAAKPEPPATPGAAPAPQTVANTDECLKAAANLVQIAESKKLGDDKLDKLEELLTKMEGQCDASQFTEAMATAGDIKVMIDAN
ncbi:MAG TPA: hypothetical protein PK264_19735, partial [Hyphomicrobiaceae bacterium]|nr:hypothetical protein [Hyphomicrobiaceae bacterium]